MAQIRAHYRLLFSSSCISFRFLFLFFGFLQHRICVLHALLVLQFMSGFHASCNYLRLHLLSEHRPHTYTHRRKHVRKSVSIRLCSPSMSNANVAMATALADALRPSGSHSHIQRSTLRRGARHHFRTVKIDSKTLYDFFDDNMPERSFTELHSYLAPFG